VSLHGKAGDGLTTAALPRRLGAGGRLRWLSRLQVYGVTAAAIVLVVIVSIGNPAFLSPINLSNMLSQWAPAGIMAVGMTAVIIAGGFDLSIAAGFTFAAVVAAMVGQHADPVIALGAAIGTGLLVGVANAILISGFKINPFITTVGVGFVVNGLALLATRNAAFIVSDPAFGILGAGRWHNFPYSGMLLIATLVVSGIALARTIYGHAIYAVGGNPEASRLSGIRVHAVISSTYIILGGCVGLAGFISASELNSAQASIDPHILFDVLTIVIVGGTSLGGGVGSMARTIVGLVIIATITNGFVLLDVSPFYQDVIKGLIIIAALIMDSVLRRIGTKPKAMPSE
jgi:ribose transport system permease protein